MAPVDRLPVGTVTFLRTDVEGSMGHVRRLGSAWDAVNAAHLAIIRAAVDAHGGTVVRTEGDACFAAFPEARAAAAAAADLQRGMATAALPDAVELRVRVGLHSGEAHLAGDDYGGFEVNRAARIAATGHGGQIVLSDPTRALIAEELPPGTSLDTLGTYVLRGVPRPERLSQLTVDGLPTAFPPPRTGGTQVGNLPDRMTSFVGRDATVEQVAERCREARLVTLTGPGGIGKTSLAIEVARTLAPDFADGAWFVPLADVTDRDALAGAVAHGIGLLDGPERSAASALLPYLAERSVVLVLDNLEHLLPAADAIGSIVRASPTSRVIVTSRAPLHAAGEQEFPVTPLTDDAIRLFGERARAVRPDWDAAADEDVVREICTLLDDLPLGIELAAARVAHLPLAVIRDRLAARLPLPGPGPRDAPTRQRTLESTVSWSHDLLSPERQALLHALAVFDGSFDLEQATAVAGPGPGGDDRLDDLLDLADQSLVTPVREAPGRVRFRLLRTIQSFALERLAADGAEADARRRHADAYVALLHEVLPDLNTSRHAEAIDRVRPDQANLRAAARWTIEAGEAERALRLAAVLWRFWHAFGQVADGRALTLRALAMDVTAVPPGVRAWAEAAAGSLAYWQADPAAAHAHYRAEIDLATEAGDEPGIADGWFNLGHVLFIEGELESIDDAFIAATIARYDDLGDELGAARARWALATTRMGQGRAEEAYRLLVASRAEFDRLDDRQYHAMSGASIAWALFVQGDVPSAARYATDALVETYAMRDLGTATISLHVGVLMATMVGRFDDALRLQGAFDALCQQYGVRPPAALERFIAGVDPFGEAVAAMPTATAAAAREAGRQMTLDEAVALVVEIGDEAASREAA